MKDTTFIKPPVLSTSCPLLPLFALMPRWPCFKPASHPPARTRCQTRKENIFTDPQSLGSSFHIAAPSYSRIRQTGTRARKQNKETRLQTFFAVCQRCPCAYISFCIWSPIRLPRTGKKGLPNSELDYSPRTSCASRREWRSFRP
jgi:hypothetical protein